MTPVDNSGWDAHSQAIIGYIFDNDSVSSNDGTLSYFYRAQNTCASENLYVIAQYGWRRIFIASPTERDLMVEGNVFSDNRIPVNDNAVCAMWEPKSWANLTAGIEFCAAHDPDEKEIHNLVELPENWSEECKIAGTVDPASKAVDKEDNDNKRVWPVGFEVSTESVQHRVQLEQAKTWLTEGGSR